MKVTGTGNYVFSDANPYDEVKFDDSETVKVQAVVFSKSWLSLERHSMILSFNALHSMTAMRGASVLCPKLTGIAFAPTNLISWSSLRVVESCVTVLLQRHVRGQSQWWTSKNSREHLAFQKNRHNNTAERPQLSPKAPLCWMPQCRHCFFSYLHEHT